MALYSWNPAVATTAFIVVWLVLGLAIFLWLKAGEPLKQHTSVQSPPQQSVQSSPGAMQAGRDITFNVVSPPPSAPSAEEQTHENLVRNGDFEQGLDFWGTGWLELQVPNSEIARRKRFLAFNGALANWEPSPKESRTGTTSLRIEHDSPYAPQVYSTLSQMITVRRSTSYECIFWVKAEDVRGGLSLRIAPSRHDRPDAWDRYKRTADIGAYDWREYRLLFHSGDEERLDVRFAAEGPVKAWLDGVVVREKAPVTPAKGPSLPVTDPRRQSIPAKPSSRSLSEVVEAVYDAGCAGCSKGRIGIWNSGETRIADARVYLESISPGFQDKREFRWVGELRGKGIDIDGSFRKGHSHFEFMSHISERGRYVWRLEIAGGLNLTERHYLAKVVVEAKDASPYAFDVHIDTHSTLPLTIRPSGVPL